MFRVYVRELIFQSVLVFQFCSEYLIFDVAVCQIQVKPIFLSEGFVFFFESLFYLGNPWFGDRKFPNRFDGNTY